MFLGEIMVRVYYLLSFAQMNTSFVFLVLNFLSIPLLNPLNFDDVFMAFLLIILDAL
jgi:hypothetical protein